MSDVSSQSTRPRRTGRANHRPRQQRASSEKGHAPAAAGETDRPESEAAPSGPLGRYRNEAVVGLAALAAVALLAAGVRYMQSRPLWERSYTLTARFEDAGGLTEGRTVTMSGIPVGTVGDVRLAPQARGVRAELRIDEGVTVPEGSVASVGGLAALGNVQVTIERGPPGGTALEEGARLPTGGGADLAETLRKRAGPLTARLDTALDGAAGVAHQADRLLARSGGDLRATARNLRRASEGTRALVENNAERLDRTLADAETLTADLSEAATDVRRLTEENGDSLAVAVGRMSRVLARLETTSASAKHAAASLETVTARVEAGEGTLGRLSRDESLYRHADSTMARLSRVMKDFEDNPKRYLKSLQLVEVF